MLFREHTPALLRCSVEGECGRLELAEATVKMEEVPAADGDQWRVAEDGRLQLQLSGKEGEMEVVLGWQRRAYKLEVRWSKRSKVHAGWCREGAASGPPLSPLATPERKARGRPRKKQGVEGVQLDDGGLGALVRKLGFGEEVVFGGGKKVEGAGDERKEQDEEEQEKEMKEEEQESEEQEPENQEVWHEAEEEAGVGVSRGAAEVQQAVAALERRKEELGREGREAKALLAKWRPEWRRRERETRVQREEEMVMVREAEEELMGGGEEERELGSRREWGPREEEMAVRVQMAWRRRVMKGLVVMGPQREDGTGVEEREERSREEVMRDMVRLQRRRWLAVQVQAVWRGRCGRRQAEVAWWDRARRRSHELGRRRAAEERPQQ